MYDARPVFKLSQLQPFSYTDIDSWQKQQLAKTAILTRPL